MDLKSRIVFGRLGVPFPPSGVRASIVGSKQPLASGCPRLPPASLALPGGLRAEDGDADQRSSAAGQTCPPTVHSQLLPGDGARRAASPRRRRSAGAGRQGGRDAEGHPGRAAARQHQGHLVPGARRRSAGAGRQGGRDAEGGLQGAELHADGRDAHGGLHLPGGLLLALAPQGVHREGWTRLRVRLLPRGAPQVRVPRGPRLQEAQAEEKDADDVLPPRRRARHLQALRARGQLQEARRRRAGMHQDVPPLRRVLRDHRGVHQRHRLRRGRSRREVRGALLRGHRRREEGAPYTYMSIYMYIYIYICRYMYTHIYI